MDKAIEKNLIDISAVFESKELNLDDKLSFLNEKLIEIVSNEALERYLQNDFRKLNVTCQERTRARYLIDKRICQNK